MNNVMTRVMGLAMGLVTAAGCVGPESSGGETSETSPGAEPAGSEAQAIPASDPRLALERSRRALDRGDGEAAVAELEALAAKLEDGDEKNEVLLELSRAYEIDGDVDAAVDVLESLLIANATRERYEAREPAEKRLRLLLTGSAEETGLRLPAKSNLPPSPLPCSRSSSPTPKVACWSTSSSSACRAASTPGFSRSPRRSGTSSSKT
jgi:hypothetical protein